MKRTNTVADVLNTGRAKVDVGDGVVLNLPLDGVYAGEPGPAGAGVPAGGTALQVIRKDAAGATTEWASLSKADFGIGNVDNTSDAAKPLSNDAIAALAGKEPSITGGTVGQFYRGDKTWASPTKADVGLSAVDNTADADKPISGPQATELAKKVAKGELVVNVKDYGATGDGATDDTTAAQSAINASPAGGSVYFPTGTFIVTALSIGKSLTVYGPGTVKHKNGAAPVSATDYAKAMFRLTSHNITVRFEGLTMDGNYAGQGTANGGSATQTTNAFVSGGTITSGRIISAEALTPSATTDRLIVRVNNCTIRGVQHTGIGIEGIVDTGATELLQVTNSTFYDMAPGIISYNGTEGYPGYLSGIDPTAIAVAGDVTAIVHACTFNGYRDPTVGPTAGFTSNVYNLPVCAIRVTIAPGGDTDATPEYGTLSVTSCEFRGFGRHVDAGNPIGVIDGYVRGENFRIIGNNFVNCYQTPVRGKANCRNVIVADNTINGVVSGGGIQLLRPVYTPQGGAFKIVDNVVKNTTDYGIAVIGDGAMSQPYALDVSITGNTVDGVSAGDGIFLRLVHTLKVSGNTIRSVSKGGITADSLNGSVEITRNTIDSAGASAITAKYVADAATNKMVLHGNQVNGGLDYGVYTQYVRVLSAMSNMVANITGSSRGFYFDGVSGDCFINGNEASIGVTTPIYNLVNAKAPFLREAHNSWNAREVRASAAPTTGAWKVGDIVWNTAPAAAGTLGWVCTTAGTPGTWKTFGSIAA